MAKYRKYTKEFKLQAARMVTEQDYSYEQAAKRLGAKCPSSVQQLNPH
jgi:transposase-like protein